MRQQLKRDISLELSGVALTSGLHVRPIDLHGIKESIRLQNTCKKPCHSSRRAMGSPVGVAEADNTEIQQS